ncbi:hypothetical protein DH2020_035909 [Rehmannia glutinosa]|uniref:Vinorine synthase-like n=1 Tax=Rehmannia glutinosa TaxID=99300 RepID=A0ABR0V570_REHGL
MKLSYLDQLTPHLYFPVIFFYQPNETKGLSTSNHVQISQHLKKSLSETLTSFYPLAGRIQDNFIIDCNDAGVEFIEARIDAQLKDSIQKPNMENLKQYLPVDPVEGGLGNEATLLVVQITLFNCGGISVGICFSHKIGDCTSIMNFLNKWAATSRGDHQEAEISRVSFDLANFFPPRDFSSLFGFPRSDENFTTKRFVFDKVKLATLRSQVISTSSSSDSTTHVKNPTNVELVSAFIWKIFINNVAKYSNNMRGIKKYFAAFHAVNLRARIRSPDDDQYYLENVFGNCIMSSLATTNNTCNSTFHELVSKLRSSIRKISDDYIEKAKNGDYYLNDLFGLMSFLAKGELEYCRFSDWCRFPIYEVDYGWGNPIWVCTTDFAVKESL